MSEPKSRARRVQGIAPGVLHWTFHDDRIDFRSDAYAVREEGRPARFCPQLGPAVDGVTPCQGLSMAQRWMP